MRQVFKQLHILHWTENRRWEEVWELLKVSKVCGDVRLAQVFSEEVEDELHRKYRLLPRCLATEKALCLPVPAGVVETLVSIRSVTRVEKAVKDPVVGDQTRK